jgi:hypothetical protein
MPISIWFKYPGNPPEVVDTAENEKEAAYLLQEYRMAYGPGSILWAGPRNARNYDGSEKTEDRDVQLRRDGDLLRIHEHLSVRR